MHFRRRDTKPGILDTELVIIHTALGADKLCLPDVPDAELVVICNASKERLVEQMPGNIFNHSCVPREHTLGINYLIESMINNPVVIPRMNFPPDLLQQFH